jgi:protein required for attachment to host cells
VATARHALSPHTDPKEDRRHNFARAIVKKLHEAFDGNGFVNLILIAPPKVLGDLRAELDENLKRAVIVEAAKELCHASESELENYLSTNGLI